MKPRLIILSDLWGRQKASWLGAYVRQLQTTYEIQYYDCCELGGIDLTDYTAENIHQQFVNGGINRAVENLLAYEQGKVIALGFSIGGVIAWKAALEGLQMGELYAISSTRLRYETESPPSRIYLCFGETDDYKPGEEWLKKMDIDCAILKEQGHDLYTLPENIDLICAKLLT